MDINKQASTIEDLNVDNVVLVLTKWGLQEFVEFVKEKELDGRKLAVSICGRINVPNLTLYCSLRCNETFLIRHVI